MYNSCLLSKNDLIYGFILSYLLKTSPRLDEPAPRNVELLHSLVIRGKNFLFILFPFVLLGAGVDGQKDRGPSVWRSQPPEGQKGEDHMTLKLKFLSEHSFK